MIRNTLNPTQESDGELITQIHHETRDGEDVEVLMSYEAEIDSISTLSGETHHIIVTTGQMISDEELPDQEFILDSSENERLTLVRDREVAIAYFLYAVETFSGEPDIEDDVIDRIGEDGVGYQTWNDNLSFEDRKERLVNLWIERYESLGDIVALKYRKEHDCTLRQTDLSGDGLALATEIEEAVSLYPSMCYRTAQLAAIEFADTDRVAYVEGVALPKQASHCVRHAWIEVDGDVVELTWPWHDLDGSEAVYIGVEIPTETIEEQRRTRYYKGAAILDESEVEYLSTLV